MPDDHLPSTIGRYEIKHLLGAGAMGSVYLAEDPRIKRKLAIKVVKLDAIKTEADRKEFLARFQREAEVSGVLNDPGIVTIYDVGDSDLGPFLAMEFVQGKPLDALIKGGELSNLPLRSKLQITCGIASALDHAHCHGIVHRDVKPGNVMLSEDGRPKLMDFGIAKREDASLTQTGTFLGTPSYASPEQIREGHATPLSDIFSFGVMVFELFSGQLPFPGTSINTILYRIVNEPPVEITPPVSGLVSEAWQRIFGRVLAKNPKERYTSCSAFIRDLIEAAQDLDKDAKAELLGQLKQGTPPLALNAVASNSADATLISAHHHTRGSHAPMISAIAVGAAALIAGGVIFLRKGGEAVTLVSDPKAVEIIQNGKPLGPNQPLLMKAGERVIVQASGFKPFEYIHRPGDRVPRVTLEPIIAEVWLKTDPSGAKVVLNAVERGVTPLLIKDWNMGQRNMVSFSHAGEKKSFARDFGIGEAPKSDQIFVLLASGEQQATGEPSIIDANAPVPVRFTGDFAVRVKVDGKDMGETRQITLPPGKTCKLELSNSQVFFKEVRTLTATPGKPISIPLPGTVHITVNTHPGSGIVTIDGISSGLESTGFDRIRVVKGPHTIGIQGRSASIKANIDREGQSIAFAM